MLTYMFNVWISTYNNCTNRSYDEGIDAIQTIKMKQYKMITQTYLKEVVE